MSYPKMIVEVNHVDHLYCDITATHHVAQSYSRSVDPRIMKEANKVLGGQWEVFDGTYGQHHDDPELTRSTLHFRVQGAEKIAAEEARIEAANKRHDAIFGHGD